MLSKFFNWFVLCVGAGVGVGDAQMGMYKS